MDILLVIGMFVAGIASFIGGTIFMLLVSIGLPALFIWSLIYILDRRRGKRAAVPAISPAAARLKPAPPAPPLPGAGLAAMIKILLLLAGLMLLNLINALVPPAGFFAYCGEEFWLLVAYCMVAVGARCQQRLLQRRQLTPDQQKRIRLVQFYVLHSVTLAIVLLCAAGAVYAEGEGRRVALLAAAYFAVVAATNGASSLQGGYFLTRKMAEQLAAEKHDLAGRTAWRRQRIVALRSATGFALVQALLNLGLLAFLLYRHAGLLATSGAGMRGMVLEAPVYMAIFLLLLTRQRVVVTGPRWFYQLLWLAAAVAGLIFCATFPQHPALLWLAAGILAGCWLLVIARQWQLIPECVDAVLAEIKPMPAESAPAGSAPAAPAAAAGAPKWLQAVRILFLLAVIIILGGFVGKIFQ